MFAIRAISSRSRAIAPGTRSTMLLGGVHRAPLFEKQREIVRRIVEALLVAGGLALTLVAAHGDDYPSRRITLIAPWPPAGAIDTTCRELAPGVGDLLGQPVVVENRPGEGIRPNIFKQTQRFKRCSLASRYSIGTGQSA